MRTTKWIRRVLIPLAVILVVVGAIFRLFGVSVLGIGPGTYLRVADTILLFVIAILLLRIEKKSEIA